MNDHVSNFAFAGLWDALRDFDSGPFESDRHISWYWRTAPKWLAKPSQEEFDRYARERVSDRVGYTRRRADAWGVIDRLFDKAATEKGITFDETIKAITFLCPSELMPFPFDDTHGPFTIIDLTKRSDLVKWLRIDTRFLPTLQMLYPFTRTGNTITKTIPVGYTTRELNLVTLPFWTMYPDAEWEERTKAITFANDDPLDWTTANVWSKWRGPGAEKYSNRFWKTPMEKVRQDLLPIPDLKYRGPSIVPGMDVEKMSGDPRYAKAVMTATVSNDRKEKEDASKYLKSLSVV